MGKPINYLGLPAKLLTLCKVTLVFASMVRWPR
jgi:hypothetical protein